MNKMRTIDKIINKVNCRFGAPMGRSNIVPQKYTLVDAGRVFIVNPDTNESQRVFNCRVPMSNCGAYDKGGAYWGIGAELRVEYTKDLSYVRFYRVGK